MVFGIGQLRAGVSFGNDDGYSPFKTHKIFYFFSHELSKLADTDLVNLTGEFVRGTFRLRLNFHLVDESKWCCMISKEGSFLYFCFHATE